MSESVQFTIGSEIRCSDGARCKLTRVIVDPVARQITHLVIEPGHRGSLGRLVPLDMVDVAAGSMSLRCTREEFDLLDPAEETQFLSGTGYDAYEPEQVGFWPYYGLGGVPGPGNIMNTLSADVIPDGEVDVRRGDPVHATDGEIGRVQGAVIDLGTRRATHVLLQEGHLWGRKQVAIPRSAVVSTSGGIHLNMSKSEIEALPRVDLHHPVPPQAPSPADEPADDSERR